MWVIQTDKLCTELIENETIQSNSKTYHNVRMWDIANNVWGWEKTGYSRKKIPKKDMWT